MQDFWFYLKLGFHHVLDPAAYDHILFLAVLTAPFRFRNWKKILLLATLFTITHCISLALSAYRILSVEVSLIEFLIPLTIIATAAYNLFGYHWEGKGHHLAILAVSTGFFGLIHGFGFSNYFNLMMAEETEKAIPLLGFAAGIEISQVLIIFVVLLLAYFFIALLKVKTRWFVQGLSALIFLIAISLAIKTFPG